MSDRCESVGAKLAGKALLGFRTRDATAVGSDSRRLSTAKIGEPPPSPPPPPKVGPDATDPLARGSEERDADV